MKTMILCFRIMLCSVMLLLGSMTTELWAQSRLSDNAFNRTYAMRLLYEAIENNKETTTASIIIAKDTIKSKTATTLVKYSQNRATIACITSSNSATKDTIILTVASTATLTKKDALAIGYVYHIVNEAQSTTSVAAVATLNISPHKHTTIKENLEQIRAITSKDMIDAALKLDTSLAREVESYKKSLLKRKDDSTVSLSGSTALLVEIRAHGVTPTASGYGVNLPLESKIIYALADYLAERFQEELALTFIGKMKSDLNDTNKPNMKMLHTILPQTVSVLNGILDNPLSAPSFGQLFRSAMEEDIKDLPINTAEVLRNQIPDFETDCSNYGDGIRVLLRGAQMYYRISRGEHPAQAIRSFRIVTDRELTARTRKYGDTEKSKSQLYSPLQRGVRLLDLISQSFLHANGSSWITEQEAGFLQEDTWFNIFLANVLLYDSKDTKTSVLDKVDKIKNEELLNVVKDTLPNYLSQFFQITGNINRIIADINSQKSRNQKVGAEDYRSYIQSVFQLITFSYKLAYMSDPTRRQQYIFDTYLQPIADYAMRGLTSVHSLNNTKNLGDMAVATMQIFKKFSDLKMEDATSLVWFVKDSIQENHPKTGLPISQSPEYFHRWVQAQINSEEGARVEATCANITSSSDSIWTVSVYSGSRCLGTTRTTLTFANGDYVPVEFLRIGVTQGNVQVNTSNTVVKIDVSGYYSRLQNEKSTMANVLAPFAKYTSFMTDVVNADSPDQIRAAIRAHAEPKGSWRVKQSHCVVALQSYVGLMGGWEVDKQGTWNSGSAAIAPVGQIGLYAGGNLFGSGKDSAWSIGLYVPLIDLGTLVSYRLKETTRTTDTTQGTIGTFPEVGFAQVFAPGVFLQLGVRGTPLTIGIGAQLRPELRNFTLIDKTATEDAKTTEKLSTWWVGINMSIDIPLLHLSISR